MTKQQARSRQKLRETYAGDGRETEWAPGERRWPASTSPRSAKLSARETSRLRTSWRPRLCGRRASSGSSSLSTPCRTSSLPTLLRNSTHHTLILCNSNTCIHTYENSNGHFLHCLVIQNMNICRVPITSRTLFAWGLTALSTQIGYIAP